MGLTEATLIFRGKTLLQRLTRKGRGLFHFFNRLSVPWSLQRIAVRYPDFYKLCPHIHDIPRFTIDFAFIMKSCDSVRVFCMAVIIAALLVVRKEQVIITFDVDMHLDPLFIFRHVVQWIKGPTNQFHAIGAKITYGILTQIIDLQHAYNGLIQFYWQY